MSANPVQLVDPVELPVISDYQFSGDNRTVESKRRFVEQYRIKASIFHGAQAARIARSTVYKWMDEDAQFALAVQDSFEDAADRMETSTYEEALGDGKKPGNPLLKMFWLKAHRPKYRDRVQVDIPSLQDEINQRMEQLGLRELPAMITSTVDNSPQPPTLIPHSNYTGYSTQVHSGNTGTIDPDKYPPDIPDSPQILDSPPSEQKD